MNKDSILHVAFCADDNYLEHWAVALYSLVLNCKDIRLEVHFIYDGAQKQKIANIQNYFNKKFDVNIELYSFDFRLMDDFKISHHVNKATYYRLLLADILPQSIDKLLFLDCDLVVNNSLSKILDFCFDDTVYVYAVSHQFSQEEKSHLISLGFEKKDDYFNAGVLWINLKKWRKESLGKLFVSFANEKKDKILWWDQDVLNVLLKNRWKELSPKYNLIWEIIELDSTCKDILQAQNDPIIIHYTRSVKPWHNNSWHPHKDIYWGYRNDLEKKIKGLF